MKTKKYFNGLLAVGIVLSMVGCASGQKEEKAPETHSEAPHWSYEGDTGPEFWGSLDPAFSACSNGTEQSPIDIELANVKLDKTIEDIKINYKPTSFTIMNNGHTIQANDASGSNSIIVDNDEYKLVQMHFHKPSEHQINGQNFEMEGHLVHKNSAGKLAVLGFLINVGNENEVLAEMWSKLPPEETEADIHLEKSVDLFNLLPQEKKIFRYSGSLTTPSCSEEVQWLVLEQPIELSKQQIEAFASIFPHNNRPVQPLNERQVSTPDGH
ncbi:carbonic anhydrase [Paenibacillus paeoniae]|uniref:Carbonic anhydrase n=1 Tax=Paenibacillus paeoniae TaxID=2292705 RepID=A0A371PH43_9BACL|nr:carbonic anhydrase family protein [Paenibacillus paeoniae]REK75540.1 carbonic anhydrase [Paenibacillus paeoniae]